MNAKLTPHRPDAWSTPRAMTAMQTNAHYVTPEQLCIGLFVHLDLSWMEHPLPFSSFKIKDEAQIETIRRLGLPRIRYEPEKCDATPLTPVPAAAAQPPPPPLQAVDAQVIAEKKARAEHLAHIRREIRAVEKKFRHAAETVQSIRQHVDTRPQAALKDADALVGQMVDIIDHEGDVVIHAMSDSLGDGVYFHMLNVAVLSLILAKALRLCSPELRDLGIGALFHDFGKTEIPSRILMKSEHLTRAEQSFLEMHCEYGLAIGRKAGLSQAASDIVMQHHEFVDGSGYPARLVSAQMTPLAKIVSLVNTYDNLCNPVNAASALTPSEALAQMFALKRSKFDEVQLQAFIRCLGVYPPGSIVQLSNGMFGLVVSTDHSRPLRPNVLVCDPAIPQDEAVIIDLGREPELGISRSLRAAQLPSEAHRYLSPSKRITYFFDMPPRQGEAT